MPVGGENIYRDLWNYCIHTNKRLCRKLYYIDLKRGLMGLKPRKCPIHFN